MGSEIDTGSIYWLIEDKHVLVFCCTYWATRLRATVSVSLFGTHKQPRLLCSGIDGTKIDGKKKTEIVFGTLFGCAISNYTFNIAWLY